MRDEVVAASAEATNVFLFSHGWNNDWDTLSSCDASMLAGAFESRMGLPAALGYAQTRMAP
jgi:hypothetical protein